MKKPINRNKTIEEQVWDDIAPRIMWFTAKQISRKLMVSVGYVRRICGYYYERDVLIKKIVANTNYYKIRP